MWRTFSLLCAALALAGCETAPLPLEPSPPPPPPLPRLRPPAPASIEGLAKFRTPEGRLASCMGLSVALVADTSRTRERLRTLYGSDEHAIQSVAIVQSRSVGMPPPEPPLASALCDSRAVFTFAGVTPGSYFLVARLRISLTTKPHGDLGVVQHIAVRPGEALQVRLTP